MAEGHKDMERAEGDTFDTGMIQAMATVQNVIEGRIREHHEVIAERRRWISDHTPKPGSTYTDADYKRWNKKRDRWSETIREEHMKIDEDRKLAKILEVDLSI